MDSQNTQQVDRTAEAMARLEAGIKGLADSAEWQRYLAMQARFYKYSYANCLLILAQRPDATRVAGLKAWNGLNRQVVRGERALWILCPIFAKAEGEAEQPDGTEKADRRPVTYKSVPVFDVSQTSGAPLPEPVRHLDGDDGAGLFERLCSFAVSKGITVTVAEFSGEANGFFAPAGNSIVVRESLAPAMQAKTMAHELGHALLHANLDGYESRQDAELEAESVAYCVLSRFGVDSGCYSFGYLTVWQDGSDNAIAALKKSAQRISRASREVINAIEAASAPVDEPVAA